MKPVPLLPDRGAAATRRRRRKKLLATAMSLGALAALVDGGLFALRHTWPRARIESGSAALAQVVLAPFGERVSAVEALGPGDRPVAVTLHGGRIEPRGKLPVASKLSLTVTVTRSGWIGWLVGRGEQVHAVVRTPAAYLPDRIAYPQAGKPVRMRFSSPVELVSVERPGGARRTLELPSPRRVVSIGIVSAGADASGTALVAAAPRAWESLPAATRVDWFQAAPRPEALVRPASGSTLLPWSPIVLTFSRPVRSLLGDGRPTLKPKVTGVWTEPNDHTLVFTPSGLGYPLGRRFHLELPRAIEVISGADPAPLETLTWQVPRASLLRIKQLLAEQGYLPLTWKPSGRPAPLSLGAQLRAAIDPPAGSFEWRYPSTPAALKSLWATGSERPTIVRGAIMAFEEAHGMPVDGFPSMSVFRALLRDEIASRAAEQGYSYVYVTETLPETLTLWHDGHVILTTPVNTGIPDRPTALGTYPVYLHLTETTMQGTNPDGTPYDDPDVPWVNYFNGGDAVHGFVRGSYGWPQSLGCVEAPVPTAAEIFPYVNVGTLVTVAA